MSTRWVKNAPGVHVLLDLSQPGVNELAAMYRCSSLRNRWIVYVYMTDGSARHKKLIGSWRWARERAEELCLRTDKWW